MRISSHKITNKFIYTACYMQCAYIVYTYNIVYVFARKRAKKFWCVCSKTRQRMAVIQQKQCTSCFWKNKKNTNTKMFYIKCLSMQMMHCKQWLSLHGSNMMLKKFMQMFSKNKVLLVFVELRPYAAVNNEC